MELTDALTNRTKYHKPIHAMAVKMYKVWNQYVKEKIDSKKISGTISY